MSEKRNFAKDVWTALTQSSGAPASGRSEPSNVDDPRRDPVGTLRVTRRGVTVVKVSMGDDTGKGQHVWLHVSPDLEHRWFHHSEVAGYASERPNQTGETGNG